MGRPNKEGSEALIQPYGAKYRILVWIENDMERDVLAVCHCAYFLRFFPLSAASAENAVLFKKGQPCELLFYPAQDCRSSRFGSCHDPGLAGRAGQEFSLCIGCDSANSQSGCHSPHFLSLTESASEQTRRQLSRRIARNMVVLMVASMLVGSYVRDFFGISLPIVRVGAA